MSRHHVTLPPITYTPVPKPKTTRRRVGVGRLQKDGASSVSDVDETEDSGDARPVGRQIAPIAGRSGDDSPGSDQQRRRTGPTTGRLSETTLRTLLLVQERTP